MKRVIGICVVLGLLMIGNGTLSVRAQDNAGTKTTEKPASATNGKLVTADLPALLQGLGYETEKVGDTAYRFTVTRGKWSFKINISISANQKKVWMSSYLAEIPDIDKVPAGPLAKLMQSNADIGPASFYLTDDASSTAKQQKWLKIGYALDNHAITPAFFREEMEWFCDRMVETADLWDISKWTAAPTR